MNVYTIHSRNPGMYLEHVEDTTYGNTFTTLHKAKLFLENCAWEEYCDYWEENIEYGWEEYKAPGFIQWSANFHGMQNGWIPGECFECTIRRTELI
jgi:hypothetical protein